MKTSLCTLAAGLALLTACQPASRHTTVTGTLTGVESDTLLARYVSIDLRGSHDSDLDTIALQEGRFTLTVPNDSTPTEVYLYAKPRGNGAMSMTARPVTTIAFPGETVTLTGSMTDYRAEGNAFHQALNEVEKQSQPYMKQMEAVYTAFGQLQQSGKPDPSVADSLREAYNQALEQMLDIHEAYVRQHANEDIAVYLTSRMGLEKARELLPILGEQARNGSFAPLYQSLNEALEEALAREEAKKKVSEGAEAPDFTLKDLQGNDLSLSSLRGKYVVLDFWGSWCGWCIKGIPDMKKYYAKYKDRMEILGIDCRDTEEKWKEAVKKHELPWLHVRNAEEPDVTVLYGIEGYPTKIVIDPQGKIAKVVVGEDPAFYEYLDQLFK